MTDSAFAKERAFLDAAAREFHDIADALAKASCRAPIVGTGADKGLLMPVQVTACFRTLELDALFSPAVQSAAVGPLKDLLLPRLERMRALQFELREKAVRAEDDESTLPGAFVETYCAVVAELRAFIGDSSPSMGEGEQARTAATGLEALPPAVQLAWSQYQGAINARQDLAKLGTDREVYDFVKRTLAGEGDGVRLPAFDTWQRYLRSARHALDCRKHEPRYGRPHGSSIVHQNQI